MNTGPSGLRISNKRFRRGMPLPALVVQQLLDGQRTLARKAPGRVNPVVGRGRGRFPVSFEPGEQKLYVGEGRVATGPSADEEEEEFPKIRPMMPKLLDVDLNAEERPFFEMTHGEGFYEVFCVFGSDAAHIQLWKDEEAVAGVPSSGAGSGDEEDAEFWLLASFTTVTSGDGLAIDENGIEQHWASDISWKVESGSSSSSGSDDSNGSSEDSGQSSGDGSDDGSEKSTAIVPASYHESGFAAWFAAEAPDVRFEDVLRDVKIRGQQSSYVICPKYLEGIEPGTLRAVGWTGDKPYSIGVEIQNGRLVITCLKDKRRRPSVVQVKISAIRKGFLGMRLPAKTRADFDANERFLKSARPKKK